MKYLQRDQNNRFRYRRGIPKHVRVLFNGRSEFVKVLAKTEEEALQLYPKIHFLLPSLGHLKSNLHLVCSALKSLIYISIITKKGVGPLPLYTILVFQRVILGSFYKRTWGMVIGVGCVLSLLRNWWGADFHPQRSAVPHPCIADSFWFSHRSRNQKGKTSL